MERPLDSQHHLQDHGASTQTLCQALLLLKQPTLRSTWRVFLWRGVGWWDVGEGGHSQSLSKQPRHTEVRRRYAFFVLFFVDTMSGTPSMLLFSVSTRARTLSVRPSYFCL